MDFFVNKEDLTGWVKTHKSGEEAASKISELLGKDLQKDITENCVNIYNGKDDAETLLGVLAKYNLARLTKSSGDSNKMEKQAQASSPESRQRNNWVRGNRNKWNRVVDGYNEGTPWRIDRDKFYNFQHYYTDALSFDADPNRVYSGEAIWRMYIMDKFTREYQNKDGKWVGGYINDRFHVFPTAGTPANPDAPRDGGNQMQLPPGIKTRKPRPHQYSVERRLEEARGTKTEDLEAFASVTKMVKVASNIDASKDQDKVYSIFKDVLDMREAGIQLDTILEAVSDHYQTSILNVAQIDREAKKLREKHSGIGYEMNMVKTAQSIQSTQTQKKNSIIPNANYTVKAPIRVSNGILQPLTQLLAKEDGTFEVIDPQNSKVAMNSIVVIPQGQQANLETVNLLQEEMGDAENVQPIQPTVAQDQVSQPVEQNNFPVEDMANTNTTTGLKV